MDEIVCSNTLKEIMLNNIPELLDKILNKHKAKIENVFMENLEETIEDSMENAKNYIFNDIMSIILGKNNVYVSEKHKTFIEDSLLGLGYTASSLRKKIYEENKENVLKAIQRDAAFEKIENTLLDRMFYCWDFKDINKDYPQSILIRSLFKSVAGKKHLKEWAIEKSEKELSDLLKEVDEQKKELSKLKSQINVLFDEDE